ncbi:MAG: glucosaminidase domain-containing protein, partial [Deltaproteobacteria bacterium]
FLHSLLPAALVVNAEIAKERETLLAIVDKIPLPLSAFTFSGQHKDWQKYVDKDETNFLMELCRKYRTRRVEKLLKRVNTIPVSLILAQGALESSWGTSRFTREGNSLFGLWTWSKDGIIPANREEGKNHKIEAYDSILASLRKYTLTLNRLDAYADFRTIRTKSLDSYKLAEGLELYSERGEDYVTDIKKVISSNNLTKFDEVQFPNVLVSMLPLAASRFSADTIAQL